MTWSLGKAGRLDTDAKNMYYNLVSVVPDFRDTEGKSHKPVHPEGAAETSQVSVLCLEAHPRFLAS